MSTTKSSTVRNGVDTAQLFGTLDTVKSNNELAQFQFRATNGGSAAPTTAPRSTRSTGCSRR